MRAGIVVSIRVNPKDCQSVLDVMERVGIKTSGQSFSQLVSLTLSSILESHRQAGIIPEPDAFQYLNRVGQFIGQGRSSKKLRTAKLIHELGSDYKAPVLTPQNAAASPQQHDDSPPAPVEVLTDQQRSDRQRLSELYAVGEDALTVSELAEYKELLIKVYGELV